jgi:putrescine aminotransferase
MSKMEELAILKASHNNPAYSKMSLLWGCGIQNSGLESKVHDEHGRAYIALFDQYGNQSFGYSHPRLINALKTKLDTNNLNSSKIMFEEESIYLTQELSKLTNGVLTHTYLANSGGETIDNALKIARAHTRRKKFIVAQGCFHGKTLATLAAANREEYHALFQPMFPGFVSIAFGDLDAMSDAIDEDTAAVLLEPVQAENGIHVPTAQYLQAVRKLCDERGALLIFDEMQTAFGRLGTVFAYQYFDVTPDILCLGKAFGGGLLPISAVMAKPTLWDVLWTAPSTFGSSLGGNPLCCAVAREVLRLASEATFLADVQRKGRTIHQHLSRLAQRYPNTVLAHRGAGMMHGLELRDDASVGLALRLLYERGYTSTYSLYKTSVLRVQPPMVIATDALHQGLLALEEVIDILDAYLESKGSDQTPIGHAVVVKQVEIKPSEILRWLHRYPNSLDPFAAEPHGLGPFENPAFAGTVGGDVFHWHNQITLSPGGTESVAVKSWVWQQLNRKISIQPGGNSDCATIRWDISWSAGIDSYESFLSHRIKFYVQTKIEDLVGLLNKSCLKKQLSEV